jgi:hypothetical protein
MIILKKRKLIREPNKKVALKLLQHNSQNITNEVWTFYNLVSFF